ncbi:histone acetyltransferase subunit nua4 protein [Besnoitia besnoiti]|uniref:Histone acetyltransferase subunit nua4 protein n=1 Tax=Besnoitia besnoiti TaxID=94643 RepID=A0A2A9MKN3_BESBE|nr:histone acetyltransferase subunit nua4 protein [Besnoitia besnoiti]PFH38555.1 histone acetyltransferase subunit nua4 protein [Besnoitia besnoiti]
MPAFEATPAPAPGGGDREKGSGRRLGHSSREKMPRQQSQHKLPILNEMLSLQEKLESDIQHIEARIYEMEGDYLTATADVGNMIKGWEGYISSSTKARRPPGKLSTPSGAQDRLFSLTSCTSRVWREFGPWTDDDPSAAASSAGNGKSPWQASGAPLQGTGVSSRQAGCASASARTAKRTQSRNTHGHGFKSGERGSKAAGSAPDPHGKAAAGSGHREPVDGSQAPDANGAFSEDTQSRAGAP